METICDEVLRLRCYLRDLVALSALPVMSWNGGCTSVPQH